MGWVKKHKDLLTLAVAAAGVIRYVDDFFPATGTDMVRGQGWGRIWKPEREPENDMATGRFCQ